MRLDELAEQIWRLDTDAKILKASKGVPIPGVRLRVNGIEQACMLVQLEDGNVVLEAR